jgi:hypothetical protein
MLFLTVSVVVPEIGETTDTLCEEKAFTRLDFPAFVLPKKPM